MNFTYKRFNEKYICLIHTDCEVCHEYSNPECYEFSFIFQHENHKFMVEENYMCLEYDSINSKNEFYSTIQQITGQLTSDLHYDESDLNVTGYFVSLFKHIYQA